MESHHDRAEMAAADDLIGHHAAIHHVNYIGVKFSDGVADFALKSVIDCRAFLPPIDKQNAHFHATRTKSFDLLLHEHAPAGEAFSGINIGYGEYSHSREPEPLIRGHSRPPRARMTLQTPAF